MLDRAGYDLEEDILLDTMFELPAMEGVEEVVVNAEVVEGKAQPLYIYSERKDSSAKSQPAAS